MKNNSSFEMILLAAIWGVSFLFMRIGGPEFGPVLLMALRTLIASLFLVPIMYLYKQQKSLKGLYGKLFLASMFNVAMPFVLYGYATLTLTAGVTSILNATTPMFAAIVAFFWLRNKLNFASAMGLFVGFIGVYVLMMDKIGLDQQSSIFPALAGLGAACCYGIGTVFTQKYLSSIKPLALAAGNQVAASLVLIPLSLAFLPNQMPSNPAIYSVLFLGLVCTGIGYILFFRLLAALGPTKTVSVTYLIPAFGLLWGALFLGEEITLRIMLGSCLILFGVGLTTGVILKVLTYLLETSRKKSD